MHDWSNILLRSWIHWPYILADYFENLLLDNMMREIVFAASGVSHAQWSE